MNSIKKINAMTEEKGALKGRCAEGWRLLLIQEGSLLAFCQNCFYLLKPDDCLLVPPFFFLSACAKSKELSYLVADFESEEAPVPAAYSLPSALADGLFAYRQEPERLPLLALCLMQRERAAMLEPQEPRANEALFLEAAALLAKNLQASPSVDTLAEELEISLSKLKRLFAGFTAIGAHEYLAELRIALAKQSLKQGRSVTETAALCGFTNQAYFSAAFKKATGANPKDYIAKASSPSEKPIRQKREAPKKSAKKADMPSYLL